MGTAMSSPADVPVDRNSEDRRPERAAVVEHTDAGDSIVILDLQTHQLNHVVPHVQPPDHLLWCAREPFLLYSVGRRLYMHKNSEEEILHDLYKEAEDPFVCSHDSHFLAVAKSDAILLINVAQLPSTAGAHLIPMPTSCRIVSMLWSLDSRFLYLLCYPGPGTESSQLIRVEATTGRTLTLAAQGATRLLGWRGTPEILLVARNHSFAEEAGTLDSSGEFRPFHPHAKPAFVGPYFKGSDQLVVQEPSEDTGDPTRLLLETTGDAPPKPWLSAFRSIRDISVAEDGSWVMFVDKSRYPDDLGGDVYLVEAGKNSPISIARAAPGKVSYSLPVPEP